MNGKPTAYPPEIQSTSNIDGQEIAFVADVAHLIKAIRNSLVSNKTHYISQKFVDMYELETDEVQFSVIEEVIDIMEEKELKIAPRISRRKCIEVGTASYGKMNVEPAAAMLSFEMASAIQHMVTFYNKPTSWLTTANYCAMVGRWYEICNSRRRNMSFDSQNPGNTRKNIEFVTLFMEYFATMKLFPTQKKLYPMQKGVCLSTTSILWLQKMLLENGVTFFLPARVCGDSVENYNSQMRLLSQNPTCNDYERFVKVLGVIQHETKKIKGSSYGFDDTDQWLSDLLSFKELKNVSNDDDPIYDQIRESIDSQQLDLDDHASLASLGGYILHHTIRTKSKCDTCKGSYCSIDSDEPQIFNTLIDSRDINDDFFGLIRPTVLANRIFVEAEKVFKAARESLKNQRRIEDKLTDMILGHLSEMLTYPECHIKVIIKRFVKCRLHFWSEYRNQETRALSKPDIRSAAAASRTTEQMSSVT